MTIVLKKNQGCAKCLHYYYHSNMNLIRHGCLKNCKDHSIGGPGSIMGCCEDINRNLDCPDWALKPSKRSWWKRLLGIK